MGGMDPKRRANLVLYYPECVFTTANNLPNSPCDELRILSAPESKALWQSQCEEQWKSAYNRWLAKWDTGALTMGELMRKPQGESVAEEKKHMWLTEVDEFGMTMMVAPGGAGSDWATRPFLGYTREASSLTLFIYIHIHYTIIFTISSPLPPFSPSKHFRRVENTDSRTITIRIIDQPKTIHRQKGMRSRFEQC